MATPEETIAAQQKQIEQLLPLAAKVPDLIKANETLSTQVQTLSTNLQSKDQQVKKAEEDAAIKTAYPNVPLELLVGATLDERKAHADKLSKWAEGRNKGGANGAGSESGKGGWQNASGTGASVEVEDAARAAEAAKKEAEAVKSGDVMTTIRLTVGRQMKQAARILKLPAGPAGAR
jgi:hypothetical protein